MGYLKEDNGVSSTTRLIFVIGSLWVMAICSYLVVFGEITPGGLVATYGSLQGVLIGLKLGQKPMEQKFNGNGTT
jgi:ABC-type bacteriocin/lantibiotic exporter with double-glycine peptidase domain